MLCRCIWTLMLLIAAARALNLEIKGSGSGVVGSTINFAATLYEGNKVAKEDDYQFEWRDNARPKAHTMKITTRQPFSNWSINYPMNDTQPGVYEVTLVVNTKFVFWVFAVSGHYDYTISDSLGGTMQLEQNNSVIRTEYVSNRLPVQHVIALRDSDSELLLERATYVQTYWFQNCTYMGVFNGLAFSDEYPQADNVFDIEALVVASFEKLPEPTTTTTTTTTTSTTTTTTTTTPAPKTTTPSTTTTSSTTSTTTPKPSTVLRRRRDTPTLSTLESLRNVAHANAALLGMNLTAALQSGQANQSSSIIVNPQLSPSTASKRRQALADLPPPPFNCVNKSVIARDQKKLYGYFQHRVFSKSPLTNFSASGQNWLQHGDMLNLDIKCKGSAEIKYCYLVFDAPYNATGNETCASFISLDECHIRFVRFFTGSKTLLFFIRNDVSEIMHQVTINFYEAIKPSQLSVVVVPVSFTLVAVILVIFGVSYYMQSRNRFNVEVADFNFAETQSLDMEYKTFHQRLFDSIREVLPWRRQYTQSTADLTGEPDSPGGLSRAADSGAESNIRYDSME